MSEEKKFKIYRQQGIGSFGLYYVLDESTGQNQELGEFLNMHPELKSWAETEFRKFNFPELVRIMEKDEGRDLDLLEIEKHKKLDEEDNNILEDYLQRKNRR